MCLEEDKAKRHGMIREFRRPKAIPPPRDMECLFRSRVDRLDEVLNATPEVQIEAEQILREIVSEIVLRPGDEHGRMLIEVRGDPSASVCCDRKTAKWDDNGGRGRETPVERSLEKWRISAAVRLSRIVD